MVTPVGENQQSAILLHASFAGRARIAMAKTDFKSVEQYIASQPDAVQEALKCVRSAIHKAMPAAEELISYQIPAYRLHNVTVLYFAGWKQHFSLYPVSAPLVAAFKDKFAPYKLSKGTIRFPLSEPVPVKLIEDIAKFRAQEVTRQEKKARSPGGRKRQRS